MELDFLHVLIPHTLNGYIWCIDSLSILTVLCMSMWILNVCICLWQFLKYEFVWKINVFERYTFFYRLILRVNMWYWKIVVRVRIQESSPDARTTCVFFGINQAKDIKFFFMNDICWTSRRTPSQVTSSMFGHSLGLHLPIQVYFYNLYNSISDVFVYFQETVEMSCPEDQKKVKSEKKVTFFQNVCSLRY